MPGSRTKWRPCRRTDRIFSEAFPFNGRTTTNTHKYGVDLTQNLFRWENWVALQRADAQVAQAEADYQAAQQDLMARVAQRYFDVLAAQDDLDAQRANLESVSRQLEQAEKRPPGRADRRHRRRRRRAPRPIAGRPAVIALQAGNSHPAQELLREITGDAFDYLARPVEPLRTRPSPDPAQRGALGRHGVAAEPVAGLEPARRGHRPRERELARVRGGHFPTLDLVASRYRKPRCGGDYINANGTPYGSTSLDQYQNVVGIQISVPIYSGGMVSSQVRQAVYRSTARRKSGSSAWRARPSTMRARRVPRRPVGDLARQVRSAGRSQSNAAAP